MKTDCAGSIRPKIHGTAPAKSVLLKSLYIVPIYILGRRERAFNVVFEIFEVANDWLLNHVHHKSLERAKKSAVPKPNPFGTPNYTLASQVDV